MKRSLFVLLVSVVFALGCSDSDDSDGPSTQDLLEETSSQQDAHSDDATDVSPREDTFSQETTDDTQEDDSTRPDTTADLQQDETAEDVVEAPQGTLLELSIHNDAGAQGIDLETMTVIDDLETPYDVLVTKSAVGPVIELSEESQAQNLGSESAFDDVTQVPQDGYASDSEDELVIGATWRAGGAGETGFEMTQNVYAIHTDGSNYAKLMVVSAKAGTIKVVAFLQQDGTTTVETQNTQW